jgi:hypothetical protein
MQKPENCFNWPINWDAGFEYPWVIACGGSETPFQIKGKWYLYMRNMRDYKNYYYSYDSDTFIAAAEFDSARQAEKQTELLKRFQ